MSSKNVLINGNFDIWQRGTNFTSGTNPPNNDGKFLVDRWALSSDGDGIVDVSRESTDVPEGSSLALKSAVQVPSKRFGYNQAVEFANCRQLAGSIASLSFQAKSSGIKNLRAAVLSWKGTVDSSSNPVSGWADVPTLNTNWEYLAVSPKLPLTANYRTFTLENITVPSDANNVAVFIWIDDADASATDTLYLAQAQLEKGASATEFGHRPYGEELSLCRRYYEKFAVGATSDYYFTGIANTTGQAQFIYTFMVEKMTPPSVDRSGASDFYVRESGGIDNATSAISINSVNTFNCNIIATTSGINAGECVRLMDNASGASYFEADAEF